MNTLRSSLRIFMNLFTVHFQKDRLNAVKMIVGKDEKDYKTLPLHPS